MAPKLKNAVQWHEGMLLQPHHFQQADRRVEQLLAYTLSVALSHPWGLVKFSYDAAALISGTVRIWELEAILPDGTVVSYHQSEGDDLSLSLSGQDFKEGVMTIYLAMPAYRADQGNATGDHPRFKSLESSLIVDENTGDGQLSYPALRPNIFLMVAEHPPMSHSCLPLFKIRKTTNGFQEEDFIPPYLRVVPQSSLGTLCTQVALRVREKAAFLTERLNTKTAELMSAEAETAAKALAIGLLPFETLLASGVAHPFDLYIHLVTLAAQLIAVSPAQIPPVFTPYFHDDAEGNFRQVINFIDGLLARIQEGYSVLVFDLRERIFSLLLPSHLRGSSREGYRLIIGAKAAPGMSDKDLIAWISQALIATQDHVSSCRDRRILGADRHFISGDEELSLMPARDVILFAIDQNAAFITPGQELCIFNVADSTQSRPAEIVLYLPKEESL